MKEFGIILPLCILSLISLMNCKSLVGKLEDEPQVSLFDKTNPKHVTKILGTHGIYFKPNLMGFESKLKPIFGDFQMDNEITTEFPSHQENQQLSTKIVNINEGLGHAQDKDNNNDIIMASSSGNEQQPTTDDMLRIQLMIEEISTMSSVGIQDDISSNEFTTFATTPKHPTTDKFNLNDSEEVTEFLNDQLDSNDSEIVANFPFDQGMQQILSEIVKLEEGLAKDIPKLVDFSQDVIDEIAYGESFLMNPSGTSVPYTRMT